MKQKLALACTLVHTPKLVLLDEPTTGVDPVSRREFWRLLSEFLAEGITIVMATPYLDEAERCTRVALMSAGQLLALDTPTGLRATFPGDIIEVIAQPQRDADRVLRSLPDVTGLQPFGERLHCRVRKGQASTLEPRLSGALSAAGVAVTTLRVVPASLEDVFIDRVATGPVSTEVSP
jgi:ABC-2 type transport system ATP-binding protein